LRLADRIDSLERLCYTEFSPCAGSNHICVDGMKAGNSHGSPEAQAVESFMSKAVP